MRDRETLKWLYRKSKKDIPRIIALSAVNVFYAVLSVVMVMLSKYVIDAATNRDMNGIIRFGVMMIVAITVRAGFKIISGSMEVTIQAKLEIRMKSELFSEILNKDFASINAHHSGDLMNRLTSDISIVTSGITALVPELAYLIAQFTGAFIVLCVFDWRFVLVFLLAGIVIFFITMLYRTKLKFLHKRVQETDGAVRSFLQESIASLIVVKTFGVENEIEKKGGVLQQINYKAKMLRRRITIIANSCLGLVFNFGYIFALLWCCVRLYNGLITYGTLTAVVSLISQVQTPFVSMTKLIPQFYSIVASAERIIEIEKIGDEPCENKQLVDQDAIYANMKALRFDNITFSYGREVVLNDASLVINKGDFVAIRGMTGIGKSTLLKLLLGVIRPDEGEITIEENDGTRLHADKMTRSLFSYVPQGNYLLSGTLRENLLLVKPEATDDEIEEALRVSYAGHFIKKLPDGLDTVIGEKGLGLSEGQVQRLAIARALLSGSPVILLDEATSALDSKTEKYVLENIKALKNRMCIIITHREAALAVCNREVVIDDNKIISFERQ